jgi:hypothetical protein
MKPASRSSVVSFATARWNRLRAKRAVRNGSSGGSRRREDGRGEPTEFAPAIVNLTWFGRETLSERP